MYAIVDCNNFYASCERVFNARLRHRPIVVLSNNDGCVIARSNEAKALGYKMGDPYFKVKEQLERQQVAVFSSNYTLYGDMSARVMEVLGRFSPHIEEYSIDEAFLCFDHVAEDDLTSHAAELRRTVYRWTGIPVSVGIAPTKTLAKVANHLAKKRTEANGVFALVSDDQRLAAIEALPIDEVWGIGRRWAVPLLRQGIATARQFAELSDEWIRQTMNVVGLRTAWELRGDPCITLELAPPPKQSLTVSRSFGHRLSSCEEIQEPLIAYVSRAAEKLRQAGLVAGHLLVFLLNSKHAKDEPYYGPSLGRRLPQQTSDTARSTRLMAALDKINAEFGRNTLVYAGSGIARSWRAVADMESPHYTTDWRQVMQVGSH